ncbi:hypothetical protein Trydic_g22132 [Trypoxylus dichotomus]
MGKLKRPRQKLHTSSENRRVVSNDTQKNDTETPLLIQPSENLFSGIDINVNNFSGRLNDDVVRKSNGTVSSKILNVFGGIDCLILMGFEERSSCFTLPSNASLEKLKEVKDDIIQYEKLYIENNGAVPQTTMANGLMKDDELEEVIKKIELPPFHRKHASDFMNNIAYRFHIAQIYDNQDLQERARKVIPIPQLEANAQENLRTLQKELKKGKLDDLEVTIQDMLILELLNWFKNDFFTWVDSPPCENCKGATKFSHMSNDPDLLKYTNRVEMHKCGSCGALTPFPRYNDLNILMATRKGRCGEWANCFTLLCRAMGWDARHVFDETDHVWTEVYSIGEKRWLHCDPCENVCDTPLMYETGWNKKVSYIIAYSGEEVQDVTWRYSSKHKEVLVRRDRCTEEELVKVLMDLREERQKNLSESRRKYLTKRLLEELCELMVERQPGDKDKKGRSSGSLSWRLARGEQQIEAGFTPYIWKFSDEDIGTNSVSVRYFTASNRYEVLTEAKTSTLEEWHKGASEVEGIFRKEEKDWKMVYLTRKEGSPIGKIKWTFEVDSASKVFDTVDINFDYSLYENGKVEVSLTGTPSTTRSLMLPNGEKNLSTQQLSGSKKIEIIATLSGGRGDVSWQHAQLFRQSIESLESGFIVTFTFRDV